MQTRGELAVEQPVRGRPEDEDERLWRAAADGETGAFETLVARHRRKLASVAARFLNDPDDTEDAVQEAFLRAFQQLGRFRGECGVRGWLISILMNVCRNKRRGFLRWRRL